MSSDFVLNVRQIMEYPLKGEASSSDAVLLQTGALGGPYAWTTSYGLVVGALDWPGSQLGVGIPLPGNAIDTGVLATHLLTPLGCTFGWNWYTTGSGRARLAAGNAAELCYDGSQFSWAVAAFDGDFDWAMQLANGGYLSVRDTVQVGRAPAIDFEVATKGYTDGEIAFAVNTINTRISNIYAELIALYNNNTVWSFNGRRGDVSLFLADVLGVGGAPVDSPQLIGDPRAPTPLLGDSSSRLATTAFVGRAIDYFADNGIVTSFNGRTGDVDLQLSDVLSVGGAPINSPHFAGGPTSPTPATSSNSTAIATTAFVRANLDILYGTVTGDINALRVYLLDVISDLEHGLIIDIERIVRVQNNPPPSPREGDLWWDSSKGKNGGNLFIWYDDPTSAQWVVANSGPPGPPGPMGTVPPPHVQVIYTSQGRTAIERDANVVSFFNTIVDETLEIPTRDVADGTTIEIFVYRISAGGRLRFELSEGSIYALCWRPGPLDYRLLYLSSGPLLTVENTTLSTTSITFRLQNLDGYWYLENRGGPLHASSSLSSQILFPGTVPIAPLGTPSSYVLHADLTWGPA